MRDKLIDILWELNNHKYPNYEDKADEILSLFNPEPQNKALTAPVDTEEKELPEFLMKDSEGKIITCFIGGSDVTEHWNNYLSKTKTTWKI
jgi:hypothetical protein